VVRELAARKLNFITLVAGNGAESDWLESFVAEHELQGCLRMLGAVPNAAIKDLMSACDIFFLPSQWEGIALSIYEAMACGRAVVGADVGGQRELVTPECGILLPIGDDDAEVLAYTEALTALLRDPQRLRAMGRRARERICQGFTLEQMAERMENLLNLAVQRKPERVDLALSRPLAFELAAQAVELRRTTELGELLWRDRDQLTATLKDQAQRVQELEDDCRRVWDDGQQRIQELEEVRDRLWNELQEFKSRIEQGESQRNQLESERERLERELAELEQERECWQHHWAYRLAQRVSPGGLVRTGNGSPPQGA
jgi:hypothetical protein